MTAMPDHAEVASRVAKVLAASLGSDETDLLPTARLQGDLGAESIDFLDIVFRLEREFRITIPRGELFPEAILGGDDALVDNGVLNDEGMSRLREYLPYADPLVLEEHWRADSLADLFTVGLITRYVDWKLQGNLQVQPALAYGRA
jgi:acyl carrier protein